jgi:O-antigen ligase
MPFPQPSKTSHNLLLFFAVFIGAAVPTLILGRAVLAVIVVLALLMLITAGHFKSAANDFVEEIKKPLGLFIVLTAISWLPGALNSNFPVRSIEAVVRSPILIVIAFLIYTVMKRDSYFQRICQKSFILVTGLAALIAILSLTQWPELLWLIRFKDLNAIAFSDELRPVIVSNELKGFSALAVLFIPVLLLYAYNFKKGWAIFVLIICVGLSFVVWETYNRAAIAGFLAALACLVLALCMRATSKKHAFIYLFLVGFVAIATISWLKISRGYYINLVPNEEWPLPVWLIDYERQTIWRYVWDIAMTAPWLGIGANTINFTPGADAVIAGTHGLHVVPGHPHNWAMEILAETGTIGLLTLTVTIIAVFFQLLIKYRRSADLKYAAAVALMGGYWGSGLFNFSYWSAWWQLSFYLVMAMCLMLNSKQTSSLETKAA